MQALSATAVDSRPSLLILYHSRTGGTLQMAQAAYAAATQEAATHTRLLPAGQAQPADLLAAQGYLFACPENLASMSGQMKEFFDRSYYPLLGRLAGRPYASMVCAGSDGSGAARQIARIATGWRLQAVAEPLILCTHAQTPEAIAAPKQLAVATLQPCREMGLALATGLALGIF